MVNLQKILSILFVSLSAAFARVMLRPLGSSFFDHFLSVIGSTLLGLCAGLVCAPLVPAEYLTLIVAVSAAGGREVVDLVVRSIKSFSPKIDKYLK